MIQNQQDNECIHNDAELFTGKYTVPVTNIAEIDFIFHQALQESVVSLRILLYISLQHLCVYIVVAEL